MSKYKMLYDEELRAVYGGEGPAPYMVRCDECGGVFDFHSVEEKIETKVSEDNRAATTVSYLKCPYCNEFRGWKVADDSQRVLQ